jgi:hypothetical protein
LICEFETFSIASYAENKVFAKIIIIWIIVLFTSPVNIRPRGVRTRGHKGDGVGDVALYLLLAVVYELLAIQ